MLIVDIRKRKTKLVQFFNDVVWSMLRQLRMGKTRRRLGHRAMANCKAKWAHVQEVCGLFDWKVSFL